MKLDPDQCYQAVQSGDRRFDGVFYVGVTSTGIYCRPSCPARTPQRANVEFHRSAASAQQAGFRACKRCAPDATPGSPEWDSRGDLVARAMGLIADGAVDRDGVDGLARRLGYSPRHLTRVLTDQLGAGPLALARSQRAQTARTLIETTDFSMTDIAFAAGFGSVRQFNDTIREVYASSPSELRGRHTRPVTSARAINLELAVRQPFAVDELFEFMASRAVPGIESVSAGSYSRSLDLPNGHGIAQVRPAGTGLSVTLELVDWRDVAPAVQRLRRLFDLNADPVAIDAGLAADRSLAALVAATPGLRSPGSVSVFETIVRAIIGQQVSIAAARTVTGRLVAATGERLALAHDDLTHVFPTCERIAAASDEVFSMPKARAATLQRVAAAVETGMVDIDADAATLGEQLMALKGIGPWTAQYVAMRGLSDPDVFMPTDLGVKHALVALGIDRDAVGDGQRWRPWRTYALHHLWHSLTQPGATGTTK